MILLAVARSVRCRTTGPAIAAVLLACLVCLACLALADSALAASPPRVTVQASASRVEVGEAFTVELRAMGEQGGPGLSSPEIAPPKDLSVVGQSEGTQMSIDQTSSPPSIQVGLRAVWQIVAQKPGRYTIPAPTVQWGGRRVPGSAVAVEVVPSTGRHRPQQQPNNPFLMPGGPGFNFSFPSRGFPADDEASEPRTATELALPQAPDASIFVHTKVDKKSVVVGQQVSLTIYVYRRIRPPQILSNHDAPLSDFLRIPLAKNPGTDQPVYAMVGGPSTWPNSSIRWRSSRCTRAICTPGRCASASAGRRCGGRSIGRRRIRSST